MCPDSATSAAQTVFKHYFSSGCTKFERNIISVSEMLDELSEYTRKAICQEHGERMLAKERENRGRTV